MDEAMLAELAEHGQAMDLLLHRAAIAELQPVFEWLGEVEEHWAKEVSDAYAAKVQPERVLTEIEAEIAELQDKLSGYRKQAENYLEDTESRVMARGITQFYQLELLTMGPRREQAQQELESAEQVHAKARAELDKASEARVAMAWTMASPFKMPLGLQTEAGGFYINSHLAEILMLADEADPRWDTAVRELQHLCRISGTTVDLSAEELEQARKAWESYVETLSPPEASPSGAEVMRGTYLAGQSIRQERSYIEDLRGAKIPRTSNPYIPESKRGPGDVASSVRADLEMRRGR